MVLCSRIGSDIDDPSKGLSSSWKVSEFENFTGLEVLLQLGIKRWDGMASSLLERSLTSVHLPERTTIEADHREHSPGQREL